MRIDVWSDVVCPWCFIGFTRLEKALEGKEIEVYHHAYELDANATTEGRPTLEVLAEKYGIGVEDAAGMMSRVTEIAAGEGLKYQLDKTLHGNTTSAHLALAYAATIGKQREFLFALFSAYFERGEAVFELADLQRIGESVGISAAELAVAMDSEELREVIAYDKQLANQIGIQGVPFFVFDQKVAVSGAESVETFQAAYDRASELASQAQ
jgi:predicted DsbA family dithiol-disulfide isomerase